MLLIQEKYKVMYASPKWNKSNSKKLLNASGETQTRYLSNNNK